MTFKDLSQKLKASVQTVPNLINVLADAFNEMEGGGSGGDNYSTEEQKVATWIDGKDLYRKVIVTNEVTLSSGTAVELNLSDYLTGYDKLIKVDSIQNTANRILPANLLPSNLQAYGVSIDVNFTTGKIIIRSGASVSTKDTFTCILYYTKVSA